MPHQWDRYVRRADELCAANTDLAQLLGFYGRLLRCQRENFLSFGAERASGSFDSDLSLIRRFRVSALAAVAEAGSEWLSAQARRLLDDDQLCESVLRAYWDHPSDEQFFAKLLMQPYMHWLACERLQPASRTTTRTDNRCPFCGGPPQLSILEPAGAASLDSGSGRTLLCASCLHTWPFRRVVCPACGEEDDKKLAYFRSPAFDHVRVDACDTCQRYLKTVDLGSLGLAVPLVDEVAAAPLDAWAVEHGYQKIELNLLGF